MKTITRVILVALLAVQWSCTSRGISKDTQRSALPVVRGFGAEMWQSTDTKGLLSQSTDVDTVIYRGSTYLVQKRPIFTENQVISVRKNVDRPEMIEFGLDAAGTAALIAFTSDERNFQRPIALRFGERWVNFPVLQSKIPNGRFIMIGLTEDEWKQAETAFGHQ